MSEPTVVTTNAALLGQFVSSLRMESLPNEVIHEAKRTLIDWFAGVLTGASDLSAQKLQTVIADVAPHGSAAIAGTSQSTNPPFAALANGYASHLYDYDDVFNPVETTIHLSSCLWPAILALGATRAVSGRQGVVSLVAGFEAGARVARAAGIGHYESAWQVTGTAGRIAAAAAVARGLDLDAERSVHAFGIAAAQAAGLREIYGSDTKALQPGKAAMDGLISGLLSEQGFTSRPTALEGSRGFLRAVSPDPNMDLLIDGLDIVWHTLENGHKLYPSASLIHPAIDAAIAVSALWPGDLDPSKVETVEVAMHPFAAEVTQQRHTAPGSDARFSAPHCIASALVNGSLGIDDFGPAAVASRSISALRDKIRIAPDSTYSKRAARVVVIATDGRVLEQTVLENRGCPGNPLSDEEIETKLSVAAEPYLDPGSVRVLINRCWDLESATDISDLLSTVHVAPRARNIA